MCSLISLPFHVPWCLFDHKILPVCHPGVVEYLSNGGVAENHKDFKELRYNECLTNFSCNGKNGNSDGSITHSFQLKSAYDSNLMPYTNYTYDFKVTQCAHFNSRSLMRLFFQRRSGVFTLVGLFFHLLQHHCSLLINVSPPHDAFLHFQDEFALLFALWLLHWLILSHTGCHHSDCDLMTCLFSISISGLSPKLSV